MGTGVSIWFHAVLRADSDSIHIGDNTNIQDGCIVHVDEGHPVNVGHSVTVGHKAMLHGCTIGDRSLIGIGAIILNGANIGKNCIIGAGALITENTQIADNSLVVGSPSKVIKSVSDQQVELLKASAHHYAVAGEDYNQNLKPC
ncbi:gamma carbonic anhydrase family protein [Psychrosphaera algicola]|uniref:Gamma carbonic anhydrase family protein n=1 Tax=Psychrosphaera algicola TaxID=3023714 RepID=A0ABT5FJZ8_9GAMM|nr:gamma carbonic anhydrase family protein [Psychrosphaera sp. G1-22]MDC2891490.1 gamma carbonic anhydrase family protein [Psychrosphaera sp. G1-22]